AKVNLFLRILAREAGGYHQIETAFALLELADEVTVSRSPGAGDVALTVHGPDLGPAEENLAVRAARAVLDATGHRVGVAIELAQDAAAAWGSIGRLGGNDFEMPVFGKHPPLRALFERLAATHPYWVRLCGSGSAVAAVYASERLRDDARMQLGEKQQRLIDTTTRAVPAGGPEPLP